MQLECAECAAKSPRVLLRVGGVRLCGRREALGAYPVAVAFGTLQPRLSSVKAAMGDAAEVEARSGVGKWQAAPDPRTVRRGRIQETGDWQLAAGSVVRKARDARAKRAKRAVPTSQRAILCAPNSPSTNVGDGGAVVRDRGHRRR